MSYTRFGTYNAVLPKGGPKVYPFFLDFTTSSEQAIDMQPEISKENIDYISGIYIDARKAAQDVEIITEAINQSIGFPAGKQGYMPLLIGDAALITFRTPKANGLIIPVHVVNFPVWPIIF